jgi:two-component system, OmpR family, phosphate regulon response regulator PhoB
MPKSILVLDEDDTRRRLHVFGLRCAGFVVAEMDGSVDVCNQVCDSDPDLILLVASAVDSRLRQVLDALLTGHEHADVPLLVMLEQHGEAAKLASRVPNIDGLHGPLSPDLLIARVQAVLDERARAQSRAEQRAGLQLDAERGLLQRGERRAMLRPTEVRLLEFLLSHPDQLLTRQQLLYSLWGSRGDELGSVVDISVCRLRRALRQLHCADRLQTIRRYGYRFSVVSPKAPVRRSSPRTSRQSLVVPTGVHR